MEQDAPAQSADDRRQRHHGDGGDEPSPVGVAERVQHGADVRVREDHGEERSGDENAEEKTAAPAENVGHGVMLLSSYRAPGSGDAPTRSPTR